MLRPFAVRRCLPSGSPVRDGGRGISCPLDEAYLAEIAPGLWQIVDKREEIASAPPVIALKLRQTILSIARIAATTARLDRVL